jgi:hypothetical protein
MSWPKAFVALALLLAASSLSLAAAAAAPAESNLATCDDAILGEGPDDWRSRGITAGPVSVFKDPLAKMARTRNGLIAKMPMLIHGAAPVTVSVPPALRGRVFLYYGRVIGRDGKPTTSLNSARGYGETRFELCSGRARTPFPGGIRVRGTKPVRLTIRVEGEPGTSTLRLGKPKAYFTPNR